MDLVTIRRAVAGDAPLLASLITRSIRETNFADYAPELLERSCAKFTASGLTKRMAEREVFVAIEGAAELGESGAVAGTVSLGMSPVRGEIRPKLHTLFVAPEHQRRGIGALLVRHIEALARGKEITLLHLSSSLTARPFYERLGYRRISFEEREDGSTWLMSKSLG